MSDRLGLQQGPLGGGQLLKKLTNCINSMTFTDSIQLCTLDLYRIVKSAEKSKTLKLDVWHSHEDRLVECTFGVTVSPGGPCFPEMQGGTVDCTFLQSIRSTNKDVGR